MGNRNLMGDYNLWEEKTQSRSAHVNGGAGNVMSFKRVNSFVGGKRILMGAEQFILDSFGIISFCSLEHVPIMVLDSQFLPQSETRASFPAVIGSNFLHYNSRFCQSIQTYHIDCISVFMLRLHSITLALHFFLSLLSLFLFTAM